MCAMFNSSNIEPCGLSEEILVPEWNISRGGVIRLPESMSFEKAAYRAVSMLHKSARQVQYSER